MSNSIYGDVAVALDMANNFENRMKLFDWHKIFQIKVAFLIFKYLYIIFKIYIFIRLTIRKIISQLENVKLLKL
jgi:hypothetical protein